MFPTTLRAHFFLSSSSKDYNQLLAVNAVKVGNGLKTLLANGTRWWYLNVPTSPAGLGLTLFPLPELFLSSRAVQAGCVWGILPNSTSLVSFSHALNKSHLLISSFFRYFPFVTLILKLYIQLGLSPVLPANSLGLLLVGDLLRVPST